MLTFEPNMNIATPTNYVVGAGDHVIIDIYGASQKSSQLEVSPDGTITVEGFGPIHIAGVGLAKLEAGVVNQPGNRRHHRFVQPRVEIVCIGLSEIGILVLGGCVAEGGNVIVDRLGDCLGFIDGLILAGLAVLPVLNAGCRAKNDNKQ